MSKVLAVSVVFATFLVIVAVSAVPFAVSVVLVAVSVVLVAVSVVLVAVSEVLAVDQYHFNYISKVSKEISAPSILTSFSQFGDAMI